ncbi:hypothetical protein [Nitrospira sp. KM1]|uniref:hypothetical protein n=1 Tax=Nitrospira sp. KM1 TaxID=1936990 RepID=UPI001564DF0F|nr:hypothetical protein [Nitrospira sp. KM1]
MIGVVLMTVSGCIMVRDGQVKPPAQWPPQVTQQAKKSISLLVFQAGQTAPPGQAVNPENAENARNLAVKAYTESGLFSSVTAGGQPADIQADITIGERGSEGVSWSGALSALTFTMIPGYVSQDVVSTTTFKDSQQRIFGMVEKREVLGFWIQFFLLFGMPFVDGPASIINETEYDMHRATIEEARGKGWF